MSDQIDPNDLELRRVVALELQAQSLAYIAHHMPAFIEALNKPRGGGNWGGKKQNEIGLLRLPPADLTPIEPNTTFKVPVIGYYSQGGGKRIAFFSPFNELGEVVADHPGMLVGSIEIGSKTWDKLFNGWNADTTGTPHRFDMLRVLTFVVSADKEDKAKRFKFISKIEKLNSTDPTSLTYAEPPAAPAAS